VPSGGLQPGGWAGCAGTGLYSAAFIEADTAEGQIHLICGCSVWKNRRGDFE